MVSPSARSERSILLVPSPHRDQTFSSCGFRVTFTTLRILTDLSRRLPPPPHSPPPTSPLVLPSERILRTFCVEGLPTEESTADGKKKRKVYRKIPPKIIQEAKGIVIFSAFRSGFAPFAGAGGGGVVIARMKDGSKCKESDGHYPSLLLYTDAQ